MYLGDCLLQGHPLIDKAIQKSYIENNWFTERQCALAIENIALGYLQKASLLEFADRYQLDDSLSTQTIGLIPAGNIPMVGFHDMICCFLSNNKVNIKLSDKDKYLLPAMVDIIAERYTEVKEYIHFVEQLKTFDAIIATGSNNTNRYFEYYFKKFPSLLRKNRSSVAILSGDEHIDDLKLLADDAFSYFGLGCRSVSKIYLPKGYDPKKLFPAFSNYHHYKHHHKFRNNFEYNNANLLLNNDVFLTDDVFILKQDDRMVSRISMLHYTYYDDQESLTKHLIQHREDLQCISTNMRIPDLQTIALGQTQRPNLMDFSDGIDTMKFLLSL